MAHSEDRKFALIQSGLAGRKLLLLDPTHAMPRLIRGVQDADVEIGKFSTLSDHIIHAPHPDVILAPLVTPSYDILDLARSLGALDYRNALRAYCRPLPNVTLVCNEVAACAPHMDFDIFELPDLGGKTR